MPLESYLANLADITTNRPLIAEAIQHRNLHANQQWEPLLNALASHFGGVLHGSFPFAEMIGCNESTMENCGPTTDVEMEIDSVPGPTALPPTLYMSDSMDIDVQRPLDPPKEDIKPVDTMHPTRRINLRHPFDYTPPSRPLPHGNSPPSPEYELPPPKRNGREFR